TQRIGNLDGLVRVKRHAAAQHRHAKSLQDLLRLILMNIHVNSPPKLECERSGACQSHSNGMPWSSTAPHIIRYNNLAPCRRSSPNIWVNRVKHNLLMLNASLR